MNNSTIATAQNKPTAAMLQDINPTIHQACVDFVQPLITDIDQLPVICDHIRIEKEISNETWHFISLY